METDDIEEYVEHAGQILDANPQMDEANTKAKLVRDLLELLGWNFATDVELEYPIPMASQTYKVDYALLLEGTPTVFVEAKGSDTSLSDDEREQLKWYMKTQDIDWGLLTNGRTNEVFRRRVEDGQITVERLGSTSVDELAQKTDLLSALSKQSIESGEAKRIAQKIVERTRAKHQLRENKDEIAEAIVRTVTEKVNDSVSRQAENEAKTLVDNLIDDLDSEMEVEREWRESSNDFWDEVENETGIVKQGDEVVFRENKTATEQFQEFTDFLFEEGYLTGDDLPIESGRKRYIVATEPVDKDGDEMVEPKPVGKEFYLETHESTASMKRKILKLADQRS